MKKKLTKDEFLEMLNELAQDKQMDISEIQAKLEAAGRPDFSDATKPIRGSVAADNMERLTDPTKYTGSHRQRFDSEGKGMGLSGRYEVASADGYVQGYKRQSTQSSDQEKEKETEKDEETGKDKK